MTTFQNTHNKRMKNFIWSELAFCPQPLICTIGAMSNKLETIALCMDHWYTIQQITRSTDSMDQWITGIRLNSNYHKLLWQSWKSHHAISTSRKCQKKADIFDLTTMYFNFNFNWDWFIFFWWLWKAESALDFGLEACLMFWRQFCAWNELDNNTKCSQILW